MDIKKAFDLWVDITGVNPGDTTIRLRDMDIHRANRVLEKSIKYDQTYVTTLMLMNMYLEDFLGDRQVSLKQITENLPVFMEWLEKIDQFKAVINSEEVKEIKSDFQSMMKQALLHYGVDVSAYESMVKAEGNLAEIRYSAFNAVNELEVVQFSHGLPSTQKPRIYKDVYTFKDINTLIKWMMSVDSGIVVAMIQNSPDLSNSYFVFAVRNGGTLSIVTDREKLVHPLQAEVSRSRARGRQFYERITSYHFPYSVMDVDFGDNHRAYVSSSETSLISTEDGVAMKEIKNLEHDEIVWLVMMFSLLEEKFFKANYQTPEISYTAQMMNETQLLLEQAKKNEVMVSNYTPLEVETLSTEMMKTENLMDNFEYEPTGQHDWMIQRYDVPEEVFQVVSDHEPVLLLPEPDFFSDTNSLSLKKMDKSSFGSPEQLKKDRLYLARYNQAVVINQKVQEEYKDRKEEVLDWYKGAVKKNLPNLLKAMAEGTFVARKDPSEARVRDGSWEKLKTNGNILRVSMLKGEEWTGFTNCHIFGSSTEHYRNKMTCAVTDTGATLVGHFYPRTANQLADLCGCEVSELHELLQHWKLSRIDPGNSILDSVDPMDWAIRDPWEKVRMDVRVYLSKKEYNRLCKEYETGNESFWLKTEEV